MKDTPPVFSIIIATYNSQSTLELCLESIAQQERELFELLIIDGASTDNTPKILTRYKFLINELISEDDDGVYDAWNKQLKNIKGQWALFLGSDDCFQSPNSLKGLNTYLNNTDLESINLIFSEVNVVNNIHDKFVVDQLGHNSIDFYRKIFKKENLFSHTGCLHRSSLFHDGMRFDKSYKIAGDYDFMLRAIAGDVSKIDKYSSVLVQMGQGGLSTSSKSRLIAYTESLKARYHNKLYLPSIRLMYRVFVSAFCLLIEKTLGDKVLLSLSNVYRRLLGKKLRKTYK